MFFNVDLLVGIGSTAYLHYGVYVNCCSLSGREFKGVETKPFLFIVCCIKSYELNGRILYASEIYSFIISLHTNYNTFIRIIVP